MSINTNELRTMFVLKYGRPDLYNFDWMLALPDEIFNLLIVDNHKHKGYSGINLRNNRAIDLFSRFNNLPVSYNASIRFEEYVFARYISDARKQERKALFKKIKDFFL